MIDRRQAPGQAIDRFARLSGRVIIAAAGDQRMALESPDNKRGIFTGALIRGLEGAADSNRNGLVEVGELAIYVEDEVPRVTRRLFNYEQFPMHDTKGQNFPISRASSRCGGPGAARSAPLELRLALLHEGPGAG